MVDPLPRLSIPHHIAIAKLTLKVSQIEWQMDAIVASVLFRHPQFANAVIAPSQGHRVLELMDSILRDQYHADEEEITALVKEIRSIRSVRNEIVHWLWQASAKADEDPDVAVYERARDWMKLDKSPPQRKKATAADIDAICHRANAVLHELTRWILQTMIDAHSETEELRKRNEEQP